MTVEHDIRTRRTNGINWFMGWSLRKWLGILEKHREISKASHFDTAQGRYLVRQGQKIVDARQRAIMNALGERLTIHMIPEHLELLREAGRGFK